MIEQTGGILQGMSGSPVYVNGRLVGAVAAGIKEMTPYTFFITPIEDMMKLWTMPDTKNKTRLKTINMHKVVEDRKKEEAKAKEEDNKKAKTNGNAILNRVMDVIHEAEDTAAETKAKQEKAEQEKAEAEKAKAAAAENTDAKSAENADAKDADGKDVDAKAENAEAPEKQAEAVAAEAAATETAPAKDASAEKPAASDKKELTKQPKAVMYLSGFNEPSIDFLQKNVPMGHDVTFMPMGVRTEGEGNTLYNASLQPGSAVGVAIVYGDFAVGATGTVTAVDGKKILGFGHPFLHRGNVNYFMTDATVVGTISGQSNGMKIANIGNIIGRISQDRETGIAGTIGDFPTVVPVKVRIQDTTLGRTDDYGARIAYDEAFLPELSGGIAYAAMTKTSDTLAGATANVHFTIRTNAADGGKFERSNMFYNTADVGQIAVGELMQAMNVICSNTDQESDIVDVQIDVQMENGRKTATLLSAVPDKTTVKPGDLVKFTTTIKPYRRDKETLLIPYRVPVTAPEEPADARHPRRRCRADCPAQAPAADGRRPHRAGGQDDYDEGQAPEPQAHGPQQRDHHRTGRFSSADDAFAAAQGRARGCQGGPRGSAAAQVLVLAERAEERDAGRDEIHDELYHRQCHPYDPAGREKVTAPYCQQVNMMIH